MSRGSVEAKHMTSQWHQSSCGPSKLMSTHVSPLDYTQLVSHHFSCSSSDELAGASQQLHRLRHNVDGQTKSCVAHSMAVPSALARDQLNCSPSFLLKTAKITSSFSSLRRKYSQGRQSKDANKNEKRENFSMSIELKNQDLHVPEFETITEAFPSKFALLTSVPAISSLSF